MEVPIRIGRPNLPVKQGPWNPLQLFLLFWDSETLQNVCDQTNSFAERTQNDSDPWTSLTKIELLHYFGCLIRIGLHGQLVRRYVWDYTLAGAPLSKNRFEQITKFIYFCDRGEAPVKGQSWWLKLGTPWNSVKAKCAKYWIPGLNLTVDEVIIKFEGRTSQKITIPGKPIPVGFKQEALADSGYILNWEACRPGENEGGLSQIEVDVPEELGMVKKTFLTNTQAIVARLAGTLQPYIQQGLRFHFYLDNLFTCWRLCTYLRKQGIAVTGTARKGACGLPPRLLALKAASNGLKWGALQVSIVHEVACFMWQDQSAVLGKNLPKYDFPARGLGNHIRLFLN
jgi:hypothetical protein